MEKRPDETDIYKRFLDRRIRNAVANGQHERAEGLSEALNLLVENTMVVEIDDDALDASMTDMLSQAFSESLPDLKAIVAKELAETPVNALADSLLDAVSEAFIDAQARVKDRLKDMVIASPSARGGGEAEGGTEVTVDQKREAFRRAIDVLRGEWEGPDHTPREDLYDRLVKALRP